MTTVDYPATTAPTASDLRSRWRTVVGLDCPTPSAAALTSSRALSSTAPWTATTVASPSRVRI